MGSGGEPRDRVPNAQSLRRRYSERRALNYVEQGPSGVVLLHQLYAAADVPAAESGNHDAPVRVSGYDWLAIYLTDVVAGGGTGFRVVLQFSGSDDLSTFADLWADEAGTGTLARKVYELPASACVFQVQVPPGSFVRAQLWGVGTGAGSRATLKMQRGMWSL